MEALRGGDPVQVGPFRLLGVLGAGGMGRVYLGQDPDGRPAAVKVVHDECAGDPHFRARFAREVESVGRVRAPWTAAVLAADPGADRPWLATEYVEGPSLEHAVRTWGPLPEETLLAVAARLAAALAELHAMGLLHRDLKPSNVLLAADGPKLIDFGIARALEGTRLTRTGMTVGTPGFMSPEQATGEGEDFASDVFSLGAVLGFAGSGQGPFGTAPTPVPVLERIVHGEPDLSAVPAALRSELQRCLAKDPAARPTAAELAARLTERTVELPAHAGPTPASAPAAEGPTGPTGPAGLPPAWAPAGVGGPPPDWAPVSAPGPASAPASAPARRSGWLPLGVLAAVLLLVAAGTSLVITPSEPIEPVNPFAAGVPFPPSPAPLPAPPTAVPGAPPRVVSAPLIPSQVPGWTAAVSTTRNAAYDVPPGWEFSSPSLIKGYRQDNGDLVAMSGVATLGDVPCPAASAPVPRAWAGVTGGPTADTRTEAREVAELWTGYYSVNGQQPTVRLGGSRPVTVGGRQGSHATAEVTKPGGSCGTPTAVVHTVALPAEDGESVIWVLLAESGTDVDVEQVIRTIRPAGLETACDPSRDAVGSWC